MDELVLAISPRLRDVIMSDTSEAFVQAACNALSFLESDHGFTLTEVLAPPEVQTNLSFYQVTYRKKPLRSDDLFIRLSTGPARSEQDLECGRGWPPDDHNTIDVFELLTIESPDSEIKFTSGVGEAFGDAQKMLDQYVALASALQDHGQRFFTNDNSLWDAVRQLRESRIQQREHEETSRLAESAFKQNDWQRVIALLESLGNNRTQLQTARLAYARKHAAK